MNLLLKIIILPRWHFIKSLFKVLRCISCCLYFHVYCEQKYMLQISNCSLATLYNKVLLFLFNYICSSFPQFDVHHTVHTCSSLEAFFPLISLSLPGNQDIDCSGMELLRKRKGFNFLKVSHDFTLSTEYNQ